MSSFSTAVACLSSSVERSAVRSRAVARDVAKLAACVAFLRLRLTIASEVVGSSTLIAHSGTVVLEATAHAEPSTAAGGSTSSHASNTRCWAVALFYVSHLCLITHRETYSKVTRASAGIAVTASTAAQAEGRAVRLDVAKALTVVALLGCRSACKQVFYVILIERLNVLSVVRGIGQPFDSWPSCRVSVHASS